VFTRAGSASYERSLFMNSRFGTRVGISIAAISGVAVAACLLTIRAQADSWDKMTLVTVSEPTQVQNTYLEPGTYMFKLANSESDRHIVQIFNRDRSHLYNTILAIPSYRVNVTANPVFTYWETPPGTAKAIRDWYYPGDHVGWEFRYPTDLRQIAAVTTFAPAPASPPPPAPEPQVTTPEPPPAPAPQALEQPAPAPREPVEIAQNTPPPPPPAAQQPAPAPPIEPAPVLAQTAALPQTASPFPAIGMAGLLSLGLFVGLRVKQLS
jgi:hypothetical protein